MVACLRQTESSCGCEVSVSYCVHMIDTMAPLRLSRLVAGESGHTVGTVKNITTSCSCDRTGWRTSAFANRDRPLRRFSRKDTSAAMWLPLTFDAVSSLYHWAQLKSLTSDMLRRQ